MATAGVGGEDEGSISLYQPYRLLFSLQLSRLRCALSPGQSLEAFSSGLAMGRGSRVASGLNDLGSCLNWLWCFAVLLTYIDSAVATAGLKGWFFGVSGRGACAVVMAGVEGKGDKGIALHQPCRLLFSLQLPQL